MHSIPNLNPRAQALRLFVLALISALFAGCGGGCIADKTVLVPPGQPVLVVRPVSAHVAHVTGHDAQGWPTWAGDTVQTIPSGYVAQPLPGKK